MILKDIFCSDIIILMTKETTIKESVVENRGTHKFDQGSVLSVLLKTALPIVVLMFFNSMYAFIDSLMSSNYVEYGEIGGRQLNGGTMVGLILPFMAFLIAFEVMIAVGSGLAYTQSLAQKKYDEARARHNEAMSMIIYSGIGVIIFTSIVGIPYILTVSGNWQGQTWGIYTEEMVMDGYKYMIILTIAFIPMQIQQSYTRVLRAEGKGNMAAVIPIITMPINIFFDWLFMSVFDTGIFGAGLATLIATSSGLVMMNIYVLIQGMQDKMVLKLKLPTFRVEKEVAMVILVFAMGSFLRRILDGSTMIVLSSYVGNLDASNSAYPITDWTGSWTVMTRSINMGMQLSLGVAQSMSMLISYYTNSHQNEKVGSTIKYGSISMVACSLFTFFVLLGMQGILFNAYSPQDQFGWAWWNEISIAFTIALVFSIPLALQPMPVMFYAGTKRPKHTLIHSSIFNLILFLSATIGITVNYFIGIPMTLYISMAIGAFIAFVSVMILFVIIYREYQKGELKKVAI